MTQQNAATIPEQHATSGQAQPRGEALTPNQKKKRRQKLAKMGKSANATSHASPHISSSTGAGSEMSTCCVQGILSADQLYPSQPNAGGRQTVGSDVHASAVSANTAITASGPATASSQSFMDSAQLHGTLTAPSDSIQPAQPERSQSPALSTLAAGFQVYQGTEIVTRSARPLHSASEQQHAGGVCRHDMSSMAMAMQASLMIPSVLHSTATVSPPGTAADFEHPPAKRQKQVFLHGNYKAYYGYRLGTEFDEDPRLQVLDRRWFHNKRCLDIGCNEGVISLGVVQRFAPLSMLGVDIDANLIKTACRALSKQRSEASQLHQRLLQHTSAELGDRPAAKRKAAAAAVRAFANVYFNCQDFANSQHASQSFDNIMCLSVTKWIHLNQGDVGLKRLFAKVADALVPGGWFVLEPQPWRSYKQARRKQDMSAAPFAKADMLQLRPEAFPDYLQQQLGFVLVRHLHVATSSAGFNRPMYLFQKAI